MRLLGFHALVQGFYIKMFILFIDFLQNSKTLWSFSIPTLLQVMRKFMLNLFYQAILLHGIKQNNTEKSTHRPQRL